MTNITNTIQRSFVRYLQKASPFSFSSTQQLELAADLIPFGVWEYDLFSDLLIWNRSLYKILGIEKKNFDHTLSSFKDIVHPDDRNNIEEIIHEAIHEVSVTEKKYTYRISLPDKSIRFIQGNIRLIKDKKNQPRKLTGVCIDITAQKTIECELKEENTKANLYLDSVEAMIVVLNKDATIKLINKAGYKITGYTERDLINHNWYDIFSLVEQRDALKYVFAKIINGSDAYPEYYEREIIAKSGDVRCIAWRNTLLRDEENNITGILATGTDITDKKMAERRLMEQNEQLRKIAWTQSHKVRKPLANIIGLLALVDIKKIEGKDEHVFQYLKQSSDELDLIIHDIIQKTKAVDA